MGGHAEGARAAETALATLLEAFWQTPHPIFDPLGFLHLSLGRAHEEVVKLGVGPRGRSASARDLRGVPGAGFGGLLGARRRQPGVSTAPGAGARAHARSQPRRGAAARGPDHRGRGAGPSDAQLRRVLSRRRCGAARDEHLDAPPAQSRRRAAALHRRAVGQSQGSGFRALRADHRQAPARCAHRSRHAGGGGLRALQRQHQRGGAALAGRHERPPERPGAG